MQLNVSERKRIFILTEQQEIKTTLEGTLIWNHLQVELDLKLPVEIKIKCKNSFGTKGN